MDFLMQGLSQILVLACHLKFRDLQGCLLLLAPFTVILKAERQRRE